MADQAIPEVVVFLCKNCLPQSGRLPVQWTAAGLHLRVKEIPCSGKIDAQYLLHALESGVHGVCVLACSKGECTLTQGNYRAEIRVRTVQRLLQEIGLDARRVEIRNCPDDESLDRIRTMIDESARRFSDVAAMPV